MSGLQRFRTTADNKDDTLPPSPNSPTSNTKSNLNAVKQLFCGGIAGCVAKTLTAPLSRLTILYQVHSLVTTKDHRPKYSMTLSGGLQKIVERGGVLGLWKGNGTSVIHRFPYSAINFYVYEKMLDITTRHHRARLQQRYRQKNRNEVGGDEELDLEGNDPPAFARLISGATAGLTACIACYPLDLVRTRLTTELEGKEHYKGIADALQKITKEEGLRGLYAGIGPTLFVAVPNFAISYCVYGSLKEYVLDDDLFINLRKVDVVTGEESLGWKLTLLCGAASGSLSTLLTFPCDTLRRRMQIQNLHILEESERMTARQQIQLLVKSEGIRGLKGLYRGLTPELLKVVPMVGVMFSTYEFLKVQLEIKK